MKNVYILETKVFTHDGSKDVQFDEYYTNLAKARKALAEKLEVFEVNYELGKDCYSFRPTEAQIERGASFVVRQISKAEVF